MNRKYFILSAIAVCSIVNAAHAEPAGHCKSQNAFFSVDEVGQPSFTVDQTRSGNTLTFTDTDDNRKVRVELNDNGRVRRVVYGKVTNIADSTGIAENIFEYSYRNGICYMSRGIRVVDENVARLDFDVDLCHDLHVYLNEHPEAFQCACGKPELDKAMGEILARHNEPVRAGTTSARPSGGAYSLQVQRNSWSDAYKAESLRRAASDPIYAAEDELIRCSRSLNPHVKTALADARIWGAATPALPESIQPTKAKPAE